MGWWSTDILGGDQPLDDVWDYEKYAGLKGYAKDGGEDEVIYPLEAMTDYVKAKVKEAFNRDPMAWLAIAKDTSDDPDYQAISAQVGAVIALAVGADMTDMYKHEALHLIVQDEWAKEDDRRQASVGELMKAIREYKGKPTVINSKGLFQVIAESMQEREEVDTKELPDYKESAE